MIGGDRDRAWLSALGPVARTPCLSLPLPSLAPRRAPPAVSRLATTKDRTRREIGSPRPSRALALSEQRFEHWLGPSALSKRGRCVALLKRFQLIGLMQRNLNNCNRYPAITDAGSLASHAPATAANRRRRHRSSNRPHVQLRSHLRSQRAGQERRETSQQ
jgi:hypothetical protein